MSSASSANCASIKQTSHAESGGEIVVVTGSSGCLGHQTLNLLISHDDAVAEIRCLDLAEPSEWARKSTNAELAKQKTRQTNKIVKYIKGDIRDINTVEACLDGADCVIHCAAKIDIWVDPDQQDRAELESINVHGTENLLRACIRLGVPKFVHVSSFETFVSYHTIYYATESTLPEPNWLLFGPSGKSKLDAEMKVRQFSNNKLKQIKQKPSMNNSDDKTRQLDSLNAVIIRFTPIYGPEDKYFVSKILQIAKFFNGNLKRFTNVWIRQQPIFVGNAAWSLIKAKQRMDVDESISGEEFHITDDTKIGDPFDFLEPFAECKEMQVGKTSLPAWPIWLLILLFTYIRKMVISLDYFNLLTSKKSRLEEAKEKDRAMLLKQQRKRDNGDDEHGNLELHEKTRIITPISSGTRWYHLITSQAFFFICNSLFLNRTKASLRLDYDPLFDPDESLKISLDWYKKHLLL